MEVATILILRTNKSKYSDCWSVQLLSAAQAAIWLAFHQLRQEEQGLN